MSGRRDGKASAGLVNWPTHLKNSREGGQYVYAVVAVGEKENFATCVTTHASLWVDTLVDDDPKAGEVDASGKQHYPLAERWFPESEEVEALLSQPLYAAVLLGTSGGSWLTAEGSHWVCGRADLQPGGESLVAGLEALYGKKVELLTFLDT